MNELLKNKLVEEIKKSSANKEPETKKVPMTEAKNDLSNVGDIELYKLSQNVIKRLTNRIKDEYIAHYYYRAANNWCNDANYKKAAKFFEDEANNELEHAQKIQKYLTDFNIIPVVPQAPTNHSFNNLIEIIHGAYKMELALMKEYNNDSTEIFSEDIATFDFLTKFRKIQREAVIEYNDLINASNLVDKTDKFQVLYFEQTYF